MQVFIEVWISVYLKQCITVSSKYKLHEHILYSLVENSQKCERQEYQYLLPPINIYPPPLRNPRKLCTQSRLGVYNFSCFSSFSHFLLYSIFLLLYTSINHLNQKWKSAESMIRTFFRRKEREKRHTLARPPAPTPGPHLRSLDYLLKLCPCILPQT